MTFILISPAERPSRFWQILGGFKNVSINFEVPVCHPFDTGYKVWQRFVSYFFYHSLGLLQVPTMISAAKIIEHR